MNSIEIRTLHEENMAWMTKVLFYEEEIRATLNSLKENSVKSIPDEKAAQVENLQNCLLTLGRHIKNLKCSIRENSRELITGVEITDNHNSIKEHLSLKENITRFERSFFLLRIEFNSFARKWTRAGI